MQQRTTVPQHTPHCTALPTALFLLPYLVSLLRAQHISRARWAFVSATVRQTDVATDRHLGI